MSGSRMQARRRATIKHMRSDRGVGVILALLFLAFLSILGSALLATTTIDVWISDNYKTATQSLYAAEAGIEQGREIVRTLSATDLAAILAAPAQPIILTEPQVWLRADANDQLLTLISIGRAGNSRKTIEATIKRATFPMPAAGLVLDSPGNFPESDMAPMLKTVAGLESLAARIAAYAADIYSPAFGESQTINSSGTANNYKVTAVDGDVNLDFGVSYGILVARGNVTVTGNFTWNGLILIIGQGVMHWNTANGVVNGGVFLARTRADDRSPSSPLGTLLAERGNVTADFTNGGGAIHYDAAQISAAHQSLPYVAIALKER